MKVLRIWLGLGRRPLRAGLLALVTTATAVFALSSPSMAGGEDFYHQDAATEFLWSFSGK